MDIRRFIFEMYDLIWVLAIYLLSHLSGAPFNMFLLTYVLLRGLSAWDRANQ